MTEIKPGYLTTEFWSAVLSKVIALAVALGAISAGVGESWSTALAAALAAAAAIAGATATTRTYIQSRNEQKTNAALNGSGGSPEITATSKGAP
jgi:hypothetical protein